MTLDTLIIFLGGFVLLEPQLGFPATWDRVILFLTGLIIVGLGVAVRRRGYPKTDSSKADSTQM